MRDVITEADIHAYEAFKDRYVAMEKWSPIRNVGYLKLACGLSDAFKRCFINEGEFSIDRPLAEFIKKLATHFRWMEQRTWIENSLAMFFVDKNVSHEAKSTLLFQLSLKAPTTSFFGYRNLVAAILDICLHCFKWKDSSKVVCFFRNRE